MGVCGVVSRMADAVAAAREPLSPREAIWVYLLKGIGAYRDVGRLDLWEQALEGLPPPEEPVVAELFDEIAMLGQANLYQAFQPDRTHEFYRRLVPYFAERGVRIPDDPDLSDW